MSESQGPYKMGTIARMTGLSPILLRAWERRYGLLQPDRGSGGHRLYTDADLLVLRKIQELMSRGRSIGEIAALGRDALLANGFPSRPAGPPPSLAQTAPAAPTEVAEDALALGRRQVVEAALALDAVRLNDVLDGVAARVRFSTLIERVIEPAAHHIGYLWRSGSCSVASEHLASSVFVYRLRKVIESAEALPVRDSPSVIAACLPGEEHQLGLLVLSYFLNLGGVRVLYLGASLPFADLSQAYRSLRPSAVLLSATRKLAYRRGRDGIRSLLDGVVPQTPVYLGGRGAPVGDPELEALGLRLGTGGEPAREAALRIAGELSELRRR